MLNGLWLGMFCLALGFGAAHGTLDDVARACTESATSAATLAIGLLGPMALWLGLVRVLHEGRLLRSITRPLGRVFAWLFPDVPRDHPALGMMTLNMASNMLGLGNAATPFGLKAMRALQQLNVRKQSASNAMVLFLVVNTSGLAVLPTGMVALRSSLGSAAPGAIFVPTILSTLSAAIAGVLAAKGMARLPWFAPAPAPAAAAPAPLNPVAADEAPEAPDTAVGTLAGTPRPWLGVLVGLVVLGALGAATAQLCQGPAAVAWPAALRIAVGRWSLLALMGAFVTFGVARGVALYDAIVAGGREAFDVAVRIIPFLVAILVATGMLRASGAIDVVTGFLGPVTGAVGLPAAALPMVFLRPLTGYGSYAVAADIMRAEGPDSLAGLIASTLMGTTETTFYVLALYLGAVGIRNGRHALWACLVADVAGTLVATAACHAFVP